VTVNSRNSCPDRGRTRGAKTQFEEGLGKKLKQDLSQNLEQAPDQPRANLKQERDTARS
jgi:hypothetical protein